MKEITLQRTYDVYTTIEIVKENDNYMAIINRNFDDLWKEQDKYKCWVQNDGLICVEATIYEENEAIKEAFKEYIENNGIRYARECTCCGKGMNEGYVIGGGCEYYCNADCLFKVIEHDVWQEISLNSDDNYWTQWDDIFDYQYTLFNNQLIETN